jgi:hypothetical protein
MSDVQNTAFTDLYSTVSFGGGGGGRSRRSSRPNASVRRDGAFPTGPNPRNAYEPVTTAGPKNPNPGITARQVGNIAGTIGLVASRANPIGVATSVIGLAANN